MSLEKSRSLPTEAALADVSAVVDQLFGTPAQPRWPADRMSNDAQGGLVSLDRLGQAAGGVTSDQADSHTGLYQEHCVICHGIAGSGAGPASRFQVPYPRDFRAGVFKWKSTPRNDKPTRDDLSRLLVHGVPGAPMPSFAIVPPSQREALIDYVIYLSVRGEVERELLARAVDELDYDETPPDEELRLTLVGRAEVAAAEEEEAIREGEQVINEVIEQTVQAWVDAEPSLVPPKPESAAADLAESIQRGREIFHGKVANCVGCHGPEGRGGLPTLDYDDWTKDFTTRIGITPADSAATKPFRKAGALPPRTIDPRVLAGGVLRGGHDPETIYRRIQHGIAGTPMPGVEVGDEIDPQMGLTPASAWDLVAYVRSLLHQ
ncbi:cytochrome c [Neorhodopirellula pilleata]|nr:cytochrome c [Neorhodopirellula pilleata]